MKAKSMKLRFLVTLYALFRHSDENHRMNSVKLNEFLKPYGLDCTSRVLNDTIAVLREFGMDVRNKGVWDNQGVWIEDRPISKHELNELVYAVTTNPHITREKASKILKCLVPSITVYQEPMLQSFVQTTDFITQNESMYDVYATICEAIAHNRRIKYTINEIRYSKEERMPIEVPQWGILLTPKCFYQTKDKQLYVIGYKHNTRTVAAIALEDIADAKISFKETDPHNEEVLAVLNEVDPTDYVPGAIKKVVYNGPAVFRARGQYIGLLYRLFGDPSSPIEKDVRGRIVYSLEEAEITTEKLYILEHIPEYGVKIKGPEGFKKAVEDYHINTAKTMLNPVVHNKK